MFTLPGCSVWNRPAWERRQLWTEQAVDGRALELYDLHGSSIKLKEAATESF